NPLKPTHSQRLQSFSRATSLRYGKGTRGAASLLQGRESVIHIVSDGVWSKVPVYKAAAAISRDRRP
ncbi:hypothetical protein, partial [Novosphingobium sp. CCH12-A3]|uniref:hypothetical protein n=1 Tax=Novosphingobium sp. CCH12-A3 TaxID=1768752 RepID=UPI001E30EC72